MIGRARVAITGGFAGAALFCWALTSPRLGAGANPQQLGTIARVVVVDDPSCVPYYVLEDGRHHASAEPVALTFDFEEIGPGDRDCTILETGDGDVVGIMLNPLSKDDFVYGMGSVSLDASDWDIAAHPDSAECRSWHGEWLNYFAADYLARRSVASRLANRLSRLAGVPPPREDVLDRLESIDPARRCAGWELVELEQWGRALPIIVDGIVPSDELRAASKRLRERVVSFRCFVARQRAYAALCNVGLLLDEELATLVDDARMAWDLTSNDWTRHNLARRLAWILPEEVPLLAERQSEELLAARRESYSNLSAERKAFVDSLLSFHGGCLVGGVEPERDPPRRR